jgi:4-amino-4-deoxy-L-arabinose transferase-like glycosyltransferase
VSAGIETATAPRRHHPVRSALDRPWVVALLLLAPVAAFLPPLPIDETRYLAVAWEMRTSGDFLVPHLNGAWYGQKPPLLFWLIDLAWALVGVHAWVARALVLAGSLASLCLLARLAERLSGSRTTATTATWLLLGMLGFGLFANAIMFDVLLTTCVLLALHGIVDLEQGRFGRGVPLTGVALALGILAKGPVMLLDVGFAAATAPWWAAPSLRGRGGRYFLGLALALALGVALALAWAIPAALHGGDDYARMIFLRQTLGRVSASFAHREPAWWYLLALPLILLPWPLALRRGDAGVRTWLAQRTARFALAWIVPTFLAFCAISGKQTHYLLPILPGFALLFAAGVAGDALRWRHGLFACALVATGAALAFALPQYAETHPAWALFRPVWPLWGALVAACGIASWALRRVIPGPAPFATAMLASLLCVKAAIVQGAGEHYDVRRVSAQVAAIQRSGRPLAHLGRHHGLYAFAGRLTEPLPEIEPHEFAAWAAAHPNGLVMSFMRRYTFAAEPVARFPFRGNEIGIWDLRTALASGPIRTNVAEPEPDED